MPCGACDDSAYGGLIDAVVARDLAFGRTGRDQLSNVGNVAVGESCTPASHTACLSVLAQFVRHIGGSGSGEQMIRSHTGRGIASVQDTVTMRNLSEVQHPRHLMCPPLAGCAKVSVSVWVFRSSPEPTGVSLLNVSPEPSRFFDTKRCAGTRLRAKTPPAVSNLRRLRKKDRAARDARLLDFVRKAGRHAGAGAVGATVVPRPEHRSALQAGAFEVCASGTIGWHRASPVLGVTPRPSCPRRGASSRQFYQIGAGPFEWPNHA